jgi:ribosome-associated translation inhibitor RaiA
MEMRIQVQNLDLAQDVRERVERRLRLALGRHLARIVSTRVTLQGEPGPEDTGASCRVRLRLRQGPPLEVEERGGDVLAAAGEAAWRVEHRLDRERSLATAGPRVA